MKKTARQSIDKKQLAHRLRQTAQELARQLTPLTGERPKTSTTLIDGQLVVRCELPGYVMDDFLRNDNLTGRQAIQGALTYFSDQHQSQILRHTSFVLCQPARALNNNQPYAQRYTVESKPGQDARIIREEILVGVRCCKARQISPECLRPEALSDISIIELDLTKDKNKHGIPRIAFPKP